MCPGQPTLRPGHLSNSVQTHSAPFLFMAPEHCQGHQNRTASAAPGWPGHLVFPCYNHFPKGRSCLAPRRLAPERRLLGQRVGVFGV